MVNHVLFSTEAYKSIHHMRVNWQHTDYTVRACLYTQWWWHKLCPAGPCPSCLIDVNEKIHQPVLALHPWGRGTISLDKHYRGGIQRALSILRNIHCSVYSWGKIRLLSWIIQCPNWLWCDQTACADLVFCHISISPYCRPYPLCQSFHNPLAWPASPRLQLKVTARVGLKGKLWRNVLPFMCLFFSPLFLFSPFHTAAINT